MEMKMYLTAAAVTVTKITVSKTSTSVGDTITWTASATGGMGTLQYCFYVYKNGVRIRANSYQAGSAYAYKVTEAGVYTVRVFAKDSNGQSSYLDGGSVTVTG